MRKTRGRKNAVRIAAPLSTAIVLAGTAWLLSGNPTPPLGPIGPTMKSLAEIEPRGCISGLPAYLSEAGSYCLTGNLAPKAGSRDAIVISASNVTLDLGGFTLSGDVDGRPAAGLAAIRVADGVACVTIRNGNISHWGGAAVAASGASELRLEGLCASFNVGGGLLAGDNSIVTHCTAKSNGAAGISTGNGSIITGCVAAQNAGTGLSGGDGGLVKDCVSRSNAENGITVLRGGCVVDSTAGKNAKIGVGAGPGATVETCSASENGLAGFIAQPGSTIRGATASSNLKDGIQVSSGCHVLESTSSQNGRAGGAGVPTSGAGILLAGDRNHVERNLVTGNAMGIELGPSLNVVISNASGGNTVRNYPFNAVDWRLDYMNGAANVGQYPFLAPVTRETGFGYTLNLSDCMTTTFLPQANMELEH